jgi:phosphoribosylformylglycinamidine cyclo-ligase
MSDEYRKRGVSPTKEDVHAAIANVSAGLYPGAFCKIIPDVAGQPDMVALMHADGAGTKSTLAYMLAAETGNTDVFRGIAQDSLVMNVDDLICVGATTGFVVSNTIGRNAHRVGAAALKAIIEGYGDFAAKMERLGIAFSLAGGETADLGDLVRTVVVDSTVFVRMPRARVIDLSRVQPGDLIVGLASAGRASYEDDENSGMGSNGLTLARHKLLAHEYVARFPETFADTMATDVVYQGRFRLQDPLPGSGRTVAWGLLSPTRTYLPVVRAVLEAPAGPQVTGIIHCSGGGQVKCRRFGAGLHYVKDTLMDVPALFRCLEDTGITPHEMFQAFNMGHRMELYCRPEAARAIVEIAESFGIAAQVVGRIEANPGTTANRVTIAYKGQTLRYE